MSDEPIPRADVIPTPLPWYRESAFRAWVKGALTDFSIAVGAILGVFQTSDDNAKRLWWVPLALAAGNAVKGFLQSAYDIFWGGPDVYEDRRS